MRFLHTITIACCLTPSIALGQVPSYRVEPIATYTTVTEVNAANELGQVVGYQLVASQSRPYVATEAGGMTLLPLPSGKVSGFASDVNDSGVIVGTVAGVGFPEPAIWTPNGSGGYDVVIPEQFDSLPSPLGVLPITGGQAVAISNSGTIVGWSQYQGFQGGPTTRFSLTGPPTNLGALGFSATVTAINDNDVIVGGGIRMDLGTGVVTSLGVPPQSGGGPNYAFVIAYAVNDQNETVVAAQQATSSTNWVTFYHNDTAGFTQLAPGIVPSPIVGRYDNNDLGDIAASGGVLFRAEGVLVGSFDELLDPASAHWDTDLGKIANDRRVYTTAHNTLTGLNAIVQLVPVEGCGNVQSYCTSGTSASGCQASLSASGTPSATASSGFEVIASSVEGAKDGLYFFGVSGRQANAWGNGTSYQCVVPPVSRAGLLPSSGSNGACDGSFTQDLNALWCPTCPRPAKNPGPGTVVQAQLWYRDPLNTSNQTTSLSDAIEFTVCP